jgi:hypothetical protein
MISKATILIRNNTGVSIPVELMRFGIDPNAAQNATGQYIWDVTCEGFLGETEVSIEYRRVGTIPYTTQTVQLAAGTIEATVDALNSLNIGFFGSYESGGSQFIIGLSSEYQFNTLILNNPVLSMNDTQYTVASVFNTVGGLQYFGNCVELGNILNPAGQTDMWNHPIGTLIKVIFTGGNVRPMQATVYIFGGPVLFDQTVGLGQTATFEFSILEIANQQYRVNFLEL